MSEMNRRAFLASVAASAGALPLLRALPAQAQGRDTLVAVFGQTINSLDLHRVGTNRASYQVAINCYDRLVSFGSITLPSGEQSFDYETIVPELAESWTISDDGLTLTFKLKPDARFWDGTRVTAEDVKWSFDRAVSAGGFPTTQMAAGGFFRPDQFEAVDEETFVVRLDYASKLALPNLAVPVPFIINSAVAKANATDADPWAMEYLHTTTAGSGAYRVVRWDQGQQIVYERNDDWTGGPVPAIRRVIMREVPSAATRRALVERGDVQVSFEIPDRDAAELADRLTVHSTPVANCIHNLCLNFKFAPFQDADVRKAVAWAVPYQAIFDTAAYGRGAPLWGGEAEIADTAWPRPFPYSTDLEKARAHMAASGYPDGFDVTLSISLDLVDWMEPTALLIQESLGQIGIRVSIDRVPGANWRTVSLVEKSLDLSLDGFGGWLDTPCYYFFWAYQTDRLFNASAYSNPRVDELTDATLHIPMDDPAYAPMIHEMFEIVIEDLPRIPLYQPALNVAMNGAEGYEFWFHRQLDIRPLTAPGA